MTMVFFNLLEKIDKHVQFPRIAAHCDVPCGIYDPISAQIAALTVIRSVDQLNEIQAKGKLSAHDNANFFRMVATKEEHTIKAKDEVRIIWGDFIKQSHLEKFPELHTLVHSIMLAGSKAKQNIDKDAALDLLDKVNRFAEIFWALKDVKTYRAICPYSPAVEVVYPDLKK